MLFNHRDSESTGFFALSVSVVYSRPSRPRSCGPARAIRCAAAMRDQLKLVNITIRAGVHTGEVNRGGRKLRGTGKADGQGHDRCRNASDFHGFDILE